MKRVMRKRPKMVRIALTTNQRNIAMLAGGRVMTRGVRVALEYWLDSHPEIKRSYREQGSNHPLIRRSK
jgi:hypothetical protein